MSELNKRIIIILAYCNRFVFPIAAIVVPIIFADNSHKKFLFWGISCVILAIYNTLGALLKWKHIYCALQDMTHQLMTPDKIDWKKFSFSDKYGIAIVLSALAGVIFVLSFFNVI